MALPAPDPDRRIWRAEGWRWALAAGLTTYVFWFASARTGRPTARSEFGASEFYRAQAASMLDGRLDVPAASLLGECYLVGERCYGYYGVTPSVLRLPIVPLMDALDSGLTTVMITIAVVATIAAALALVRRLAGDLPAWMQLGVFAVLGPAGALMALTRPFVFDEAVAWSLAATLIAFVFIVDAVARDRSPSSDGRTRPGWRWWAAVGAGIAAANSRPTAIASMVVLGAGLCVWTWRRRARGQLIAAACLAVLPGLSAAGVFVAKFDAPVPDLMLNEQVPESRMWAEIMAANGNRSIGPEFAPTALLAYFRPDSAVFERQFPWLTYRQVDGATIVPPLADGGAFAGRLHSATTLMPLAVAASVFAPVVLWRRRRIPTDDNEGDDSAPPTWLIALLASAGLAATSVTLTNVAITQRNVLDFYPAFVVAVGVAAARPWRLDTWRRGVAIATVTALVGWSAFANFALAWRFTPR